jgi:ribosomal protein L35
MEITWTDGVKSAEILHRFKEIGIFLHTSKRRKANWTGHIMHKKCFLKHVIEGKKEGTRRGERRLQELLLMENEETVSRKKGSTS